MRGAFSGRRGLALYLLAWLLPAAALAVLAANLGGAGWSNSVLFAVPLTLVYAFACGFSAYFLCRAWPLARQSGISILAVLCATALLASAGWTGLGVAWNAFGRSLGQDWAGIELVSPLMTLMFWMGVILYGLSALGHYLAIEFARASQAERRELESRLMAQDAELRMLRTQIDPHFLFNSLNSISALTSSNPAGARAMTLQLADFFRHSLGLEAHRKVTLDTELRLVLHFVAIEQVRFGERLRFGQEISADAGACLLPPMILQPLVENALKHGIGNLTGGGAVRIVATRAATLLRIAVENDIDPEQPAAPGSGIGLANVRQRLAAAYGSEAAIHWARRDALFRVELTLPAETEGVPA